MKSRCSPFANTAYHIWVHSFKSVNTTERDEDILVTTQLLALLYARKHQTWQPTQSYTDSRPDNTWMSIEAPNKDHL